MTLFCVIRSHPTSKAGRRAIEPPFPAVEPPKASSRLENPAIEPRKGSSEPGNLSPQLGTCSSIAR